MLIIVLSPIVALILNFYTFNFFKGRNKREPDSIVVRRERIILINITLQGILSIIGQYPMAITKFLIQQEISYIPDNVHLIVDFLLFVHFSLSTLITIIFLKDVRQEVRQIFTKNTDNNNIVVRFMKF
uniref:7TM_GPCR_Srx domain-containing protein n=1 Tax=Parastrongyloides trichosuri TaxID=131310 RepID=A0A0N5A153_PARTI